MKLLIANTELTRALATASRIVEKTSNAASSSALLQAYEGGLRVVASSKAMTWVGTFAANVEAPGEVAVDAPGAMSVAKVLPAGTVDVRTGENNRVDMKCLRSTFKLSGLAAAEFAPMPDMATGPALTIKAADLRTVIDRTAFAIAPDDNRYGLNGAHLDSVDTPDGPVLRIVATDGNRLAYAQAPYAGTLAIGRRMLVPRTPLLEVRKMIEGFSGDIEIGFSERAAVVRFEGTTVHMRLLEAEFPKYQEVMPTTFKRRVVVDRRAALDSLRRVGIFAVDKSHSVRLACSADGIVLTARKLDAGDAREELPVVAYSGEALTLGTNGGYLTDALNACGEDTVEISLCDALSPMQIRGLESADTASPSCLFIVMPVRLD